MFTRKSRARLALLAASSLLLVVMASPLSGLASASPAQAPSIDLAFTPSGETLGFMVAASLSSAGLTATPSPLSWSSAYQRVFYESALNFSEGGYDAYLYVQALEPQVNPFAPLYALVAGSEGGVAANLTDYERTGSGAFLAAAETAIYEAYYELPILYIKPLWAVSPGLSGLNPTCSAYYPFPWDWSGIDNVTYLEYGIQPSTVLPLFGSSGLPAYAVFQPLVQPTSSGYEPCLAVNWTEENYTTWVIQLRSGVRFQNGEPMTADDVVWSVKTAMDPVTGSVTGGFYRDVLGDDVKFVLSNGTSYYSNGTTSSPQGEVVALSDQVVEFKLPRPFSLFYPLFMSSVYVYPMSSLAKIGDLELMNSAFSRGSSAVGTGPYQIVGIRPGAYVLRAFQGYWNGSARVKHVTVAFSTISAAQAIGMLEKGEVQVVSYDFWPYQFYGYGQANATVKWLTGQPVVYAGVLLNLNSPYWGTGAYLPASKVNPLEKSIYAQELREALSCLMPRAYFAQALFYGFAQPASSPITPLQAAYAGISLPPELSYNDSLASEDLAQVGYNSTVSGLALAAYPKSLNQGEPLHLTGFAEYQGKPLGGAIITVMAGKPFKEVQKVTTTPMGTFNLTVYPPSGSYYVELTYPGNETAMGLIPPLSSPVEGPIKVVNWWEANAIYLVVLVVLVALLVVLVFHYMASRSGR